MMDILTSNSHWFALIGGFITAFSAAFILYLDDSKKYKANKKTFSILGLVGGLLTITSAFISYIDNDNKSKANTSNIENIKNQNSILIKNNTLLGTQLTELNEQNKSQIQELTSLKTENLKLLSALLSSKNQIIDNYIGGDSYGMIIPSGLICSDTKLMCYPLGFQNMGKSPIYDVVLNYYEPEEYDKHMINNTATTNGNSQYKNINIGNVVPQRVVDLGILLKTTESQTKHFVFYIGSRNGIYYQESFYVLNPHNDTINIATRIKKYNPKTNKYREMKSFISKDFPQNKIKWLLF